MTSCARLHDVAEMHDVTVESPGMDPPPGAQLQGSHARCGEVRDAGPGAGTQASAPAPATAAPARCRGVGAGRGPGGRGRAALSPLLPARRAAARAPALAGDAAWL